MTPHQVLRRLKFVDQTTLSETNAESLVPVRQFDVIRLTSAGAETRTLARPVKSGLFVTLNFVTDGGDITLTVTGGYDEAGTTTMVFSDTGDFAILESMEEGSGTYVWRLIRSEGVSGPVEAGGSMSLAGTLAVTGVATTNGGLVQKSSTAAAITTTRTLTSADSGGVFSVAKTSAYAITLPTPAQGIRFKFLIVDTGANIVTISNGSAHLFGIVSVNSVNTVMTGTTISLASGNSVGDWISFEGISATQYLVNGATLAAADITIA